MLKLFELTEPFVYLTEKYVVKNINKQKKKRK